jgi:predicted secreted hydrolase
MAHFALTDISSRKFRSFERLARGSVGLAGAEHAPFRVWLENWSAASTASDFLPLRLRVGEEDVALDLELRSEKPIVLQGDRGLSRKSATVGNASYYYSLTRLGATGKLSIGGREVPVRGSAWMDREWSTSALGEDQVGWDWFALQLDDETELMFYQLRREDGSADPASAGSFVTADGNLHRLRRSDVELRVTASWLSPHTGASYPSGWRLQVPSRQIDLEIRPLLSDQEWHRTFQYWEGAVRVTGTSDGRPVAGRGYVELTGYAGDARGQ